MSRRATVVVAAALLVVAPTAAFAMPAERTAWWSTATGGGVVVPQPSTAEGDLHIARAVDTQAFAAVLYRVEGSTAATLVLAVREGRTAGTPDLVACPTVGTDWQAGGNQPIDRAPRVDCDAGLAFGLPSLDGTSISFGLDASQQVEPGVWSLALVPRPEGTLPFSVDLVAPEDGGFSAEPGLIDLDDDATVTDDLAPVPDSTDSGLSSGSFDVTGPPTSFDTLSTPPLLSGTEDATGAVGGVAPPVVSTPDPGATRRAAPRLAAAPAGLLDGPQLAALLALVALAYVVGRASGQPPRVPQLLGGRARVLGPAALAGPGAAMPDRGDRPRGIGRFARVRDAAPRRLR